VPVLCRADDQFPGHDTLAGVPGPGPDQRRAPPRSGCPADSLALDRINGEDLDQYRPALRQYAAQLSE
jgi:hypothetical protein